jgi:DNA recombination-dependent growth factor C
MDSKTNKKPMTEAQKKARLQNLQKGREIRKKKLESKGQEYDLSSDESDVSDSESDNEAFVISRKKKVVPKEVVKQERSRKTIQMEHPQHSNNYQKNFDELKTMIQDALHKKNTKAKSSKRSGGTKIVVLPQNTSQQASKSNYNDPSMDFLKKSLGL